MLPPLIVVAGPTGVGKSQIALTLAERLGGEIVAADSMQVYRGLDIGTAKPDAEEQRRVPHHLLDLVDPDQPFTAADYARLADAAISGIRRRGRPPIVVAGTGLYVRALLLGLFDGPGENALLREALRQEARRAGPQALHLRLCAIDPGVAATIHPNDLFRTVRALEVGAITGRPISILRQEARRDRKAIPGPVLKFGLQRQRENLYQRVEIRVEEMMARGFLEEVRRLLNRGYVPTLKPLRAIGYRHLIGHLRGQTTLDQAVAHLKRDTKRYAKRQLTWFRHEEGIGWLYLKGSEVIEEVVDRLVEQIEAAWARRV